MPQPVVVRIVERASIDPHAGTDESVCKVRGEEARVAVAQTPHTVQMRVAEHADKPALKRMFHWMVDRPAMRGGAVYGWHRGAPGRCNVHILRKSEKSAMDTPMGPDRYERHKIPNSTYRDADRARKEIKKRAGGPARCASHLGIMAKVPGLAEFADSAISALSDRIDMPVQSFEPDGVTTTIRRARDHMLTGLLSPGLLLHNNDTERIPGGFVMDRKCNPFPNWTAARNFSANGSFALTCEKNRISVYDAAVRMAQDPSWNMFASGIPPPVMRGAAAA